MKKISILLLAITVTTASIFAQEKHDTKKMRGKHRHEFAKQLNLSDQQKQQIKEYKDNYRKQIQELEKNENITLKEYRDRKESLRKEQKSQFENLLTTEQKSKMSQLKEEHKSKAEAHHAKRLEMMKSKLNLSETQVAEMKKQREAMHDKLKSIKENESLSREQKRGQLIALKESIKEEHKKIFTAEQLEQLEEMKSHRKDSEK